MPFLVRIKKNDIKNTLSWTDNSSNQYAENFTVIKLTNWEKIFSGCMHLCQWREGPGLVFALVESVCHEKQAAWARQQLASNQTLRASHLTPNQHLLLAQTWGITDTPKPEFASFTKQGLFSPRKYAEQQRLSHGAVLRMSWDKWESVSALRVFDARFMYV